MAGEGSLLRPEERAALAELAEKGEVEGQRAEALLLLDEGRAQAEAAEESGLTINQVRYVLAKFEEKRLLALPDALALLPADPVPGPRAEPGTAVQSSPAALRRRLEQVLATVDELIRELRTSTLEENAITYSPARMLALVRDSAARYAPDVQLQMLEPFENMTQEDLLDIETWKGIAYMITYSAQFQANKTKEQLNAALPEPVKPDTLTSSVRGGVGRVTPQIVKDIAANLEGATREDMMDPDTWKGLAYMISYSAQFQANQAKDILNEQLPEPLKPDTVIGLLKSSFDRYAPEVAKQIVATFEDATLEDLLDPETWKGVWYLLNYSLQFQAEQMKQRLLPEEVDREETAGA